MKVVKGFCNKFKLSLVAFGISFIAISVVLFLTEKAYGTNNTVLFGDFGNQFLAIIKLFFRKLTGGGSFGYSFEYSLGDNVLPQYATYAVFSPFNLIYLLIKDVNVASEMIVILKMAFCAFCFSIFAKTVLKSEGCFNLLFSVLYSLSGFLVINYHIIIFMDGIYILPIIFTLIYKQNKGSNKYYLSLAYAYSFIVNYYTAYIIGICSLLFFVLLLIFDKPPVKRIRIVRNYCFNVFIALLLSMWLILPTIVTVFNNMADDRTMEMGLFPNIIEVLSNGFAFIVNDRNGYFPYFYCGIISIILTIAFFVSKKVTVRHKAIAGLFLGFLLICSIFKLPYIFMHAFDAPDSNGFRFAFVVSFALLSIGAYMADSERISDIKTIVISVAIAVFVLLTGFVERRIRFASGFTTYSISRFTVLINMTILGILLLLLIVMTKHKKVKLLITIVCLIEAVACGVYNISKLPISYAENRDVFENYYNDGVTIAEAIKETDKTFYRVGYTDSFGPLASALFGYNGIGYFSSVENLKIRNTLCKLGYATSPRYVCDFGGSDVTRMLFSEKYSIYPESTLFIRDNELLEKNTALGLGVMVNEAVKDIKLEDANVFENQNNLISAMLGEQETKFNSFTPEAISIVCNLAKLEYDYDSGTAKVIGTNEADSKIEYTVECKEDVKAYAYFSKDNSLQYKLSPRLTSEGVNAGSMCCDSVLDMPYQMEMGRNGNGDFNVAITFGPMTECEDEYNGNYFYYEDMEAFENAYEQLKRGEMTVQEWKDGYVKGTVNCSSTRNCLFFAIPYDANWNATIDGVKTTVIPIVNDTFLAVDVPEGAHEIELVYNDRSASLGRIISLAGILIWIVLSLICNKQISGGERDEANRKERD